MKNIINKFLITTLFASAVFVFAGCEFLEDRGNMYDPLSPNFEERAPITGNDGIILAESVGSDSLVLKWTAAEDDLTEESDLEYAVYQSGTNNIASVTDCETNGTVVQDYTKVFTSKIVTGLTPSTNYYFNVVVRDSSGNKVPYTMILQATTAVTDTTAPVPGNSGTVTASNVIETSLDLSWTAATDNITASADLQYAVYQSIESNIGDVLSCEINGTLIQDYTANLTAKSVTGLAVGTTYYFNVIVKDALGNKAVYAIKTQATAADTTEPTAGGSGTITADSIADTSLSLSWTAATDNITSESDLQYAVYRSASNNIITEANCISNGTLVQDYTSNLTSKTVTGLTASNTYYFNVLVKDAAGNVSEYATVSATTLSAPDTIAPSKSSSYIYTSNVVQNSLTLTWTKASDDITTQNNLQYAVYRSTVNNIDNLGGCTTYGTLVQDYTADINTCSVTGLTAGTTYYFNVVAKDAAGNQVCYTMKTQATLAAVVPTVTTTSISRIGQNNAMSGGTVTFNGGVALTAKGICWSTTNPPTISNSKTSQGTTVSSFISNLYPLVPGTTYYVRAYATNSVGTGYGSTVSFTTGSTYALGDTGQAGGRIFYIFTSLKIPYTKTYYEVLPLDHGTTAQWSKGLVAITGADGTAVGTGSSNTDDIVAQLGSNGPAAYGCYNLVYPRYGEADWFLPSIEELSYMYQNLKLYGIGDFSAGTYWSSSEYNASYAKTIHFGTGKTGYTTKTGTYYVRPIRTFNLIET